MNPRPAPLTLVVESESSSLSESVRAWEKGKRWAALAPVLQYRALPGRDLLFPVCIVAQGIVAEGRRCITIWAKEPRVPPGWTEGEG